MRKWGLVERRREEEGKQKVANKEKRAKRNEEKRGARQT